MRRKQVLEKGRCILYALLGLVAVFGLTSCQEQLPQPDQITVNGYVTDRTQGKVDFNLSAFKQGQVITTGQVTAVSTQVSTPGYSGQATICGQIVFNNQVTAIVTLDATGSMSWNDPSKLRNTAAKAFIDRLGTQDKAAVASFDTFTSPTPGYRAIRVWQDLTNDKALLKSAVDKATFDGGATNLWDAVADSADVVATNVNPVALVFTDGEDNSSSMNYLDAANYAKGKGVKVFMAGLGNTLAYNQMQEVARITGGTFADTSDPNQLQDLFDRIFNAMRASFCVSVVFSPVPNPGTTIDGVLYVTLNGKTLTVPYQVTFR